MNEMELINQQMQVSAYWNTDLFAYIWFASIMIQLTIHLLTAWGLWKMNKKLWEPHAWVSWIPLVNIYSYVSAAWYPDMWMLWLVLWMMAMMIPIIGMMIFLILLMKVLHAMSKSCWKWAWTTVGLFFMPFIMFPVLAYNCNPKNKESTKNKENMEL